MALMIAPITSDASSWILAVVALALLLALNGFIDGWQRAHAQRGL